MHFATQLPQGLSVTATFDRTEVLALRGEAVQLRLAVHNRGTDPVQLKVVHRVEPTAHEKQLDLVQCGTCSHGTLQAEKWMNPGSVFRGRRPAEGDGTTPGHLEFVPLE
jgi:hypothetical protein